MALPSVASAQSVSTARAEAQRVDPLSGWRLFGGAGVGYGFVSSHEFSSGPGGGQYLFNLDFGYQAPKWIGELEAGWFYNRVSGVDAQGRSIWIRTRSGLAEASARYRISDRWQLGPVVDLAFGADTSQAPTVGANSSSYSAGLKLAYEFPVGRFPVRVWQKITTDLDVPGRSFVVGMTGLQIGLPVRFSKGGGGDAIRFSAAAPRRDSEKSREVRIMLDPKVVFFHTNSSRLRPEVASALAQVGSFLRDDSSAVSEIEVDGHADRRGRYEYNLKLSRKRAQSVLNALVEERLPIKTKVAAFSFKVPADPRDTPDAWARNRRVELIFRDVRDPGELIARLKPLTDLKPAID